MAMRGHGGGHDRLKGYGVYEPWQGVFRVHVFGGVPVGRAPLPVTVRAADGRPPAANIFNNQSNGHQTPKFSVMLYIPPVLGPPLCRNVQLLPLIGGQALKVATQQTRWANTDLTLSCVLFYLPNDLR